MNQILHQQTTQAVRGRTPLIAALVLGCIFGTVNQAAAQVQPPATPDLITAPAGNTAFLLGRGVGTQGYVCLPTSPGASTASWTVNNARPEATLFTSIFGKDFEIITHFLSPDTNPNEIAPKPVPFGSVTWQSSLDSSRVWAQVFAKNMIPTVIPAGSDPSSCPTAGSIGCVLLQSIGSEQGPAGGKVMTQVTFIQRLNTKGGSAPADGCSVSSDVGKQTLVPYSADYFFYKANTK